MTWQDDRQGRYNRVGQCEGKMKYVTRDEARVARRRVRGRFGTMRVYRCGWCDYYHLGHAYTPPEGAD